MDKIDGAARIKAERSRQIEEEGFLSDHDAGHGAAELVRAAIAYAGTALPPVPNTGEERVVYIRQELHEGGRDNLVAFTDIWPEGWAPEWDKRDGGSVVRNLTKAGALIAAEIDRLLAADADDGGAED
jgi:hypothetical protein